MRNITRFIYQLSIIAVLLCGTHPLYAAKYFDIRIEQGGREVPITDHQVTLDRQPFTIVVYFSSPDGVLVNASFSPESFEPARTGRPFQEIPGFSDLGMAEEAFNTKALLMVSSRAPHYWYYQTDANHRFNKIDRQNGLMRCQRIVGQVMYRDSTKQFVSVKKIAEDALYFVFMKTEWTPDFSQQIEKQREYLKILFR